MENKTPRINTRNGALCALLAAALYALNAPVSKLLLGKTEAVMLAALLYLGAGIGIAMLRPCLKKRRVAQRPLVRADLPYVIGMVALDVAAPILLLIGLKGTEAANISLLNNFEIVATALIAALFFREHISRRLFFSIALVTAASLMLSLEDEGSLSFSASSLCALGACLCWGLENNCTRRLSDADPMQIVVIKGFGSGLSSLLLALALGQLFPCAALTLAALALGFVAYGLSISFYVYAQRLLGAARTSTYYAAAPFIGALLSLLIYGTPPGRLFLPAFLIMAAGAALAATDDGPAQK